jgi:hypothetical protein
MGIIADPNYRKLPRAVRKTARNLLRHKGYHRATELRAAAGSMDHQIRSQSQHLAMPGDPGDQLSQRVRIGRETRVLLRRLLDARDHRVQKALIREFREDIARRIALHIKRSQALATARRRTRQAAAWTRARAAGGRARVSQAWKSRDWERAPQVRGRAPRTAEDGAPTRVRVRKTPAQRWARARTRSRARRSVA